MAARLDPAEFALRPMRESDIEGVLEVERAAYENPWTEGIFRDCLRVGYCCWLAEDAAGPAAYLMLSVGAGEAHLLNLCVAPWHERRGLGRRMLRQALHLARDHGAKRVFLEVRPSNTRALQLYQRSGFTKVGTRRGYYPRSDGGREDAVVLALAL